MSRTTTIGITLGDFNGIGPEVAVKAAFQTRWPASLQLVLIGSADIARQEIGAGAAKKVPAWNPRKGPMGSGKIMIWDPDPGRKLNPAPGRIRVAASRAAALWIREAAKSCVRGVLDGMVTAPIAKEGFHRAGIRVPGHTEYLAGLTGTDRFAMLLTGGPLRVVLVTRHIPLRQVAGRMNRDDILDTIRILAESLPWLGCRGRRIGVCGLNPHAGEGGKIGREEVEVISPAIRSARRRGLDVVGPVPADTLFYRARKGEFDAVVAMYHDQGLGPLKMLAFEKGVNITLGLPIVRTSPDHGTAFNIAGQGCADPSSMVEAVKMAYRLARRPNPWRASNE